MCVCVWGGGGGWVFFFFFFVSSKKWEMFIGDVVRVFWVYL
eukprot:COSAG03_NODE_2192_length_3024_cov_4.993846_1_plen_40_part_10